MHDRFLLEASRSVVLAKELRYLGKYEWPDKPEYEEKALILRGKKKYKKWIEKLSNSDQKKQIYEIIKQHAIIEERQDIGLRMKRQLLQGVG